MTSPLGNGDFESGANGDAASIGNTGATTVSVSGSGTSAKISTAQAFAGTRSVEFILAVASGTDYLQYSITATGDLYVEGMWNVPSAPDTETTFLWFGNGATRLLSLNWTTGRIIRIRDGANAATTLSTAVTANTWVKVAMWASQNATTGSWRVAWSDTAPYTTWNEDTGTATSKNTGASQYNSIRLGGRTGTGTNVMAAHYLDNPRYASGIGGFPVDRSLLEPLMNRQSVRRAAIW